MRTDELNKIINKYYGNGIAEIQEIVRQKIAAISDNGDLPLYKNWKALNKKLIANGLNIEDMSYLQFPNLQLIIDEENTQRHIKERKSLVVVLSLLGPYYTYYYKYSLFTRLEMGFYLVGEFLYLDNRKFQLLTPHFGLNIKDLVTTHFNNYTFVNHYYLMTNKEKMGIPFNHPDQVFGPGNKSSDEIPQPPNGYSLFEYLFDATNRLPTVLD